MLIGGAADRKKDGEGTATGSFVAFSDDGKNWTKPEIIVNLGRWLWRVTWHDGKAYGISYVSVRPAGADSTQLVTSEDGVKYMPLVAQVVQRRNTDRSDSTIRTGWHDVLPAAARWKANASIGVPKAQVGRLTRSGNGTTLVSSLADRILFRLPSGQWLAAGRFFDGENPKATKLAASINVEKNTIEPILTLPSGGDTSYPGLLWHDDVLWMSYYSSHEGKTSIYLAKIAVE